MDRDLIQKMKDERCRKYLNEVTVGDRWTIYNAWVDGFEAGLEIAKCQIENSINYEFEKLMSHLRIIETKIL